MKTFFFKKILSHPPCCPRVELLSTAPGPSKSASHSCTTPCWSQHPCPLYLMLQDLGLQSATRHCRLCHTSCVMLCPLGMACLPTLAAKRATSHLGSAQESPPSRSWCYFSGLHPGRTDHSCLAVPTVRVAWDTGCNGWGLSQCPQSPARSLRLSKCPLSIESSHLI